MGTKRMRKRPSKSSGREKPLGTDRGHPIPLHYRGGGGGHKGTWSEAEPRKTREERQCFNDSLFPLPELIMKYLY